MQWQTWNQNVSIWRDEDSASFERRGRGGRCQGPRRAATQQNVTNAPATQCDLYIYIYLYVSIIENWKLLKMWDRHRPLSVLLLFYLTVKLMWPMWPIFLQIIDKCGLLHKPLLRTPNVTDILANHWHLWGCWAGLLFDEGGQWESLQKNTIQYYDAVSPHSKLYFKNPWEGSRPRTEVRIHPSIF